MLAYETRPLFTLLLLDPRSLRGYAGWGVKPLIRQWKAPHPDSPECVRGSEQGELVRVFPRGVGGSGPRSGRCSRTGGR